MTSTEHKKHTSLARLSGNFGRNEWAIVGSYCTTIKLLSDQVISALSSKYKCAYADTSHNDEAVSLPGRLSSGAIIEYTDQINHQQFNYITQITPFKQRQLFAEADIILVNGNHQPAKAQVVIIDINKKASLQKRVEQLTNVQLFLLADNAYEIFDFIKESIPNWPQIPVYRLNETDKIIAFFTEKLQHTQPVLNGLILAGGKSTRMGFDKGAIELHGKPQRHYMADMLRNLCAEVFISCRSDQEEKDAQYATLQDTFIGLGPYGAILSAFREKPDCAWLVIACDLPLLDMKTLKYLADNRDPSKLATTFGNGYEGFPEPLITIWEPKSYSVLLAFLAQGYSCPRKVLINNDTHLLTAPDTSALTNVNTQEELEKVKSILKQITTAI